MMPTKFEGGRTSSEVTFFFGFPYELQNKLFASIRRGNNCKNKTLAILFSSIRGNVCKNKT